MCNEVYIAPNDGARGLTPKKLNALAETAVDLSTGAVALYGFSAYNAHSAAVFLQIFDDKAANVTVGTTVPKYSFPIPPTNTLDIQPIMPILKNTDPAKGMCVALTAGAGNNTAPGAAGHLNAFIK